MDIHFVKNEEWPDEDLKELCYRIRQALPLDDPQKFTTDTGILNWKAISFKSYSHEECQKKWMQLLKPLSHTKMKLVTTSNRCVGLSKSPREKWLESIVLKRGGKGRTTEAIYQRYDDRIRALNPSLYPNEPPRPPRTARNFYWITLPNYHKIKKRCIQNRWRNLTRPWKVKYTAMFKEKQAEYLREFEKFLRNLPRKELLKLKSVMLQRSCAVDIESSETDEEL